MKQYRATNGDEYRTKSTIDVYRDDFWALDHEYSQNFSTWAELLEWVRENGITLAEPSSCPQ